MNTLEARRGFTLTEILLVVGIIGILSLLAVPKVLNAVNRARQKQAEADLTIIAAAINQLTSDTGKYPSLSSTPLGYDITTPGNNLNEVEDLSTPDAGLLQCATNRFGTKWQGPYLEKLPIDPWGKPYFFDSDYNVGPNNADAKPGAFIIGGGKGMGGTFNKVVVGSYGPNKVGNNTYDGDDLYIILRQE